jgi:uncharacterized DUF497 family protein
VIAVRVEWDKQKNKVNMIKHGVSFEEAATVFNDEEAIVLYDENHSDSEERFLIIGMDIKLRELTVCHCYRCDETVIRLISARKATKNEIGIYKGGRI